MQQLFQTSSKSKNEIIDTELVKDDGPETTMDDLISKNISPSVSNRKSLKVLNDRTNFERQLVGLQNGSAKIEKPKKGSILVITATIVKEDEKTMIEPESVNAKIMEKLDSKQTSETSSDADENSDTSFVDEIL